MPRSIHHRSKARRLLTERLEPRQLLASDFTNPVNPLDVNADTHVSPTDVVVVANKLNSDGAGQLPAIDGATPAAYYDVNGNGQVEPNDLLRIVNAINGGPMLGRVIVSPPTMGVQGQPVSFSLATELLEEVDYGIDWDGDGSDDETIQGSGEGVVVDHAFTSSGQHVVRVTAQVKHEDAAFVALTATEVVIAIVEMQNGNLVVGGTAEDDTIEFTSNSDDEVSVEVNGLDFGPFSVSGNIMAYGQAGDDLIESPDVPRPAEFHGGPGQDLLRGGSNGDSLFGEDGNDELMGHEGHDVLVGGLGNDVLIGSGGRDVLIGGLDEDQIEGGNDDDILVGGPTRHDSDADLLIQASDEWASSEDLLSRTARVRRMLNPGTIFNDAAYDNLTGQEGGDWFFGHSVEVSDHSEGESLSSEASLVNIPVDVNTGAQLMPVVAVNPLDPENIVIAYMDQTLLDPVYSGIAVKASHDGGVSWNYSSVSIPEPFDHSANFPKLQFDDLGKVYLLFGSITFLETSTGSSLINYANGPPLADGFFQSHNGVFLARSEDGGLNWTEPAMVTGNIWAGEPVFGDGDADFAIDTFSTLPNGQPNPNYGNIYVTWTRYHEIGSFPWPSHPFRGQLNQIAVSRDGGATWETQTAERETWDDLNDDEIRQDDEVTTVETTVFEHTLGVSFLPDISVGPEGDVYVSEWGFNLNKVYHSSDGGSSFIWPDETTGGGLPAWPIRDIAGQSLANNRFFTYSHAAIVADPTQPGHVYWAHELPVRDGRGVIIDGGQVHFARSTDYGNTWSSSFLLGTSEARFLNDDNDGRDAADSSTSEVVAGQGYVDMVIDDHGNILVIWADQRRDPANRLIDIFGTISTDGGQTFSPNFRITDASFDGDKGSFIDLNGDENFEPGLEIGGLDVVNDTAYVTWTDTRNGSKDVYFAKYPLALAPTAFNDRFEPNDSPEFDATPTTLGRLAKRTVPKLAIGPNDEDWFLVESAATGNLIASVLATADAAGLQVEVWDKGATKVLATGTDVLAEGGQLLGTRIVSPINAGQEVWVRVSYSGTNSRVGYSLDLEALTEDLGAQVHATRSRTMKIGDEFLYRLTTGAAGTLEVQLNSSSQLRGNLKVEILASTDLSVLAAAELDAQQAAVQRISLPVEKNQVLLVRVSGDSDSHGDFSLNLSNRDQFSAMQNTARYPIGPGLSSLAVADLNNDQHADVIVSSALTDTVSVLLAHGDGTFRAPREYTVGAFVRRPGVYQNSKPNFGREVAVGNFNADDFPDVVVSNSGSSDVSVLLGRGDGTFEPQRRFNATEFPLGLDVADLNGDGFDDLVATDSSDVTSIEVTILLARGDGTFEPQRTISTLVNFTAISFVRFGDFDNDGNSDLAAYLAGVFPHPVEISLGSGDGTLTSNGRFATNAFNPFGMVVGDLNNDGNQDIVVVADATQRFGAFFLLGDGTGVFPEQWFLNPATRELGFSTLGTSATGIALADLGSEITLPDSSTTLGPPDGYLDVIVSNLRGDSSKRGEIEQGHVVVLPAIADEAGSLVGLGSAHQLAVAKRPMSLATADFNSDGVLDVAVADLGAVLIIYGRPPEIPPNDTPETARDFGPLVHLVEQERTITPGREDAYFKLTVPTEAVPGAGDQIIDFSALVEAATGAGLAMELLDTDGNVLATGERFRIRAKQGEELLLHIFGVEDADGNRGFGAYTVVIDVLPQVVSVEAEALLPGTNGNPGGPTTSLVITLQGDRLDPNTAQHVPNYTVTHAGADNELDTADDIVIPITEAVYSPSTNIDISSGLTFPTAVRQTVTLLFDDALPAGSYSVDLASDIRTAPFNEQEDELLAPVLGFNGHPVVTLKDDQIIEGSAIKATDLVLASGELGALDAFNEGTRFLSQTHADLGAILDRVLTELGDDPIATQALLDNLSTRLLPSLGERGERPVSLMALWLDPVSIQLEDEDEFDISYDLQSGQVVNEDDECYVEVGGNVQIIVCAVLDPVNTLYSLFVDDVPERARGGAILISAVEEVIYNLTDDLRSGITQFALNF